MNENEEEQDLQPEEVVEETATEGEKEETDWKAEALKYKAIADRKEKQIEKQKEVKKPNNELTRDEIVLLAKGCSDEDLNLLKKIQAGSKSLGQEVSLADAMNDPMFQALKEKQDAAKKAEQAQLGASGASGNYVEQKFVNGQSKEDHKKLWAEEMKKF